MINTQEVTRILQINGLDKDSPLEKVNDILTQLQYIETDRQEVIETLKAQGWFLINVVNAPQSTSNLNTAPSQLVRSPQQISKKSFTIIVLFVLFFLAILWFGTYFYLNMSINNSGEEPPEIVNNEININLASSTENNDTATNILETLASTSVNIQKPIATSSKTQAPIISQTNQAIKYSELILNDTVSTKINANSNAGYNVTAGNGSSLSLMLGWVGDGISISLTNPQGKVKNLTANAAIDSSSKMTGSTPNPFFLKKESQFSLMYSFEEPVLVGNWKLVISNLSTQTIDFSVSIFGRSNIHIVPQSSSELIHSKNGLILKVAVGEKTSGESLTPLLDLNIKADILDQDRKKIKTLTLSDEPYIDTGLPYDGIYSSPQIFDLPYGDYGAVYTVSGKDSQGNSFAQKSAISGGTYISVSSENAQILGDPTVKGLDFVEGITSIIQADLWVDIKKDGNYILSADFVSPSGEEMGVSSRFSTITGPQGANLMLRLDGYKDIISNGVYKIKDIKLFEETSERVKWVDSWLGGDNGNGIFVTQSFIVK